MITDSYFSQGSTHRVCQDYAAHGDNYVVVSDGCSMAEHSDFGARLLTRAAIQGISENKFSITSADFYREILARGVSYARAMGLSIDCLFATLLIAQKIDKEFVVTMQGDGVIVAKYPNHLYVCVIEFPSCAPFYLRYFLEQTSLSGYRERAGTKYIKYEYTIPKNSEKIISTEECNIDFNIDFSHPVMLTSKFNAEEVEFVSILSDGATAFYRTDESDTHKQSVRIDPIDIVQELMQMKNCNPGFVHRRCLMALKKFDKLGWKPADDFSIGVITK
jgi:hypothetical protein